jgi:hypothetical protein
MACLELGDVCKRQPGSKLRFVCCHVYFLPPSSFSLNNATRRKGRVFYHFQVPEESAKFFFSLAKVPYEMRAPCFYFEIFDAVQGAITVTAPIPTHPPSLFHHDKHQKTNNATRKC